MSRSRSFLVLLLRRFRYDLSFSRLVPWIRVSLTCFVSFFYSQIGMLFNSTIAIPLFVTCGVAIPYPDIQGWLRVWLYELNPWVRITSSMLTTELQYVPSPLPLLPFHQSPNPPISLFFAAVSKSHATLKNSPSSTHRRTRRARLGRPSSLDILAGTWITRPTPRSVDTVPSRSGMSTTPR